MSQTDGAKTITVTVEDSGPGVEPENIEKIFAPYFTTKSAGMGMGLAICRSIVGSHGGRITATNRAGHGTAFHLTLPLHSEVK
jgi:signal transduction histidine kinase